MVTFGLAHVSTKGQELPVSPLLSAPQGEEGKACMTSLRCGPLWFPHPALAHVHTILSLNPLKMILLCVHHLSPARTLTEPLAVNNDFNNSSPFCRATPTWPGAGGMPPPGSLEACRIPGSTSDQELEMSALKRRPAMPCACCSLRSTASECSEF